MSNVQPYPNQPPPPRAQPPAPKRRSSGRTVALVGIVLALGLVAGAGGGYLSRNGEVNRIQDDLTASKAETETARQEAETAREEVEKAQSETDAVRSQLSTVESRLEACDVALEDLRDDLLALIHASISESNGEYLSALDTLESIDASVSPEESECAGEAGVTS